MGFYVDIALLVFVVAVGIRGFYNGFIDEVAGLLGIVVGVFLASRWAHAVGASFSSHVYAFKDPSLNDLVGFVVVLAGVWIAFLVLGIVVSKAITLSNLGVLDKILGFVFACAKMFLILSFLLYAISRLAFMKTIDNYLHTHSQVYPYMYSVASHILRIKEVQEFGEIIQQKAQNAKKESIQLLEKTQKSLAPTH
ncbi:CvpA family protein [Helicobacter sp. NHP22-001]|uniref:CvpA family protein n=1 Tax=Helicobacter sp. NHP22-001 TaxID=3040202 RepID=UPI002556343D|nr:CvpA family protein [Helicobacter sp. NHP22-001]